MLGQELVFQVYQLNICFPHLKISIVDSLQKRINFLSHLTQELGLQNVKLFHDRAETFGKNQEYRESFDVVTARAVARLSVLSELCLPLVKEGRFLSCYESCSSKGRTGCWQKGTYRF